MLAISLSFLLFLIFSPTITQAIDHFLLDCGSSTTHSNCNLTWSGDEHSKFMTSNITTSFSSIPDQLRMMVPQTPYSTARIFNTSSFTYTFPVSQGPKCLRLYFYPAAYSDLDIKQSYFDVSSNGYSLLTNFSAFLASFYMGPKVHHFVKEFFIYVKDTQTINVTFTPSPNSYAFINGIEILSMPEYMYFKNNCPKYLNRDTGPIIDSNIALENIYRLNIGGEYLSGKKDVGMYGSWEPDLVYLTRWSMGKLADKYNLTWILPVDSGFYYMLRLHFCFRQPYNKRGQVFKIFINNHIAEEEVGSLNLTEGSRYRVLKDYVVFVHDQTKSQIKQDLRIAMHPNPLTEGCKDLDLNAVEVFKLSMDKNLASPNPELRSTTTLTGWTPTGERNNKKTPYAMITGGIGGAVVWSSMIVLIVFWLRRRRVKHNGPATHISSYGLPYSESVSSEYSHLTLASDQCRRFSLPEVKVATHEFNDRFVIGNGGFGKVYKGCIDNATTTVAIKRLDSSSTQGFQEFRTEIEMMSKLRHVQLVSLIGYCDDEGEMILVYDYMAYGTLREHLYNTNKPPLSWKTRLDICIGVAKGLNYLHVGGMRAVIHGDVKSTNILLDENWVAKLSDFGLSKLSSEDQSKKHVSTGVKGSVGYTDPEYCWTQQLTKKSDVYSFGVVLFEVLCARPVIDAGLKDEQVSLVEWGKTFYRKGTLLEIIDPVLRDEITPGCLKKFGEVASKCLHEEGSERPAMEEVVWRLEFALQLQEDAEKVDGHETMEKTQELSVIMRNCKENLPK